MSDLNARPDRAGEIGRRFRSAFAVLLSLAVLAGGGWFVYSKASSWYYDWRTASDYIGDGTDEVVVTIPKGATITKMGGILVDAEVIKTVSAFKSAAALEPRSASIQAGNYKLRKMLPAATAVQMLLDPANLIRKRITVPEGLRLSEQLPVIAKGTGLTVEQLKAALAKPGDLGLPDYVGKNPEGVLFPDTYEIADEPTAVGVLKAMIARYTSVTDGFDFDAKAKALGITPYQALVVASIIEKEVFRDEDRPKVARVIYNRLKAGMPLQLDSTVLYAMNSGGTVKVSIADTKTKSPYNTYLNKGLPPGPISAPGFKALEAAVSPVAGDWLYWVTVNLDTGETLFSTTREEHDANAAKLQQWCAANADKCK